MLRFKDGVIIGSPSKELLSALYTVIRVFDIYGYDCWITSLIDGTHNGKPVDDSGKDPHYVGKACDFRIHEIPPSEREQFINDLKEALGSPYVVLREFIGYPWEHIHIQTDKAKE